MFQIKGIVSLSVSNQGSYLMQQSINRRGKKAKRLVENDFKIRFGWNGKKDSALNGKNVGISDPKMTDVWSVTGNIIFFCASCV